MKGNTVNRKSRKARGDRVLSWVARVLRSSTAGHANLIDYGKVCSFFCLCRGGGRLREGEKGGELVDEVREERIGTERVNK